MAKTPNELAALLVAELQRQFPRVEWATTGLHIPPDRPAFMLVQATLTTWRAGKITTKKFETHYPLYFLDPLPPEYPLARQAKMIAQEAMDDFRTWLLGKD